jgi:hypothetical protein
MEAETGVVFTEAQWECVQMIRGLLSEVPEGEGELEPEPEPEIEPETDIEEWPAGRRALARANRSRFQESDESGSNRSGRSDIEADIESGPETKSERDVGSDTESDSSNESSYNSGDESGDESGDPDLEPKLTIEVIRLCKLVLT